MREVECDFRTQRGTVHTIAFSAEIIEINRKPHILGFGLDVTERKRGEAELRRTLAREKQLGQWRSNFVRSGMKASAFRKTDREWLFNAFYRGSNVGDRPGTGLGLLIVKFQFRNLPFGPETVRPSRTLRG